MEGCPQAPCQFWNTWAWQSMIMALACGRTSCGAGTCASRGAELLHVELEQPLDLAVDGQELAVHIEEAFPLRIAVADRKGVRPPVERIARIDHVRPALVAFGQQDHVAVAADPNVG